MDQEGHPSALLFNLKKESPFSFKCQVCSACCHNKAIRIAPYDAFRLARNLKTMTTEVYRVYTEEDGLTLRNKPDGSCIFLDSRGCGVHPDRPLVCRLFPLGQITDGSGVVRYASMPLHPDCLGLFYTEGTVGSYLESQGAVPYFRYDKVCSPLVRKIARKLSGPSAPSLPFAPWLDVDASVASYCQLRKLEKPESHDDLMGLYIRAMEEWIAGP
jgi:uncharacterized protein